MPFLWNERNRIRASVQLDTGGGWVGLRQYIHSLRGLRIHCFRVFSVPVYVFSKGGNTVFMDVLKPVGNQLEKVTIPIPLE